MSDPALTDEPSTWSRRCLCVVVVAWGVQAIVAQTLLLREALVLMSGSELSWGIVLSSWLLGVGVGATLAGWFASRLHHAEVGLVLILLALGAVVCVDLWVFRGARAWLGVAAGELLPLHKTALSALLFVSPAGALVGAAFPLACCVIVGQRAESRSLSLSGIYALESAGSLVGGALFTFWAVEHLAPIQTALLCAAVTAGTCAALLVCTTRKRPAASVTLGLLAVLVVGACVWGGESLNRHLIERRWRDIAAGYELQAEAESRYQNLAVGHRAGQYTLYCNGQVSVDFPDPWSFVPQTHLWMCQHPAPQRVLVIGGGAEGVLAEILKHPVREVVYVEPDPRLIELVKPFLSEADRRALDDPRVTLQTIDARFFVKSRGGLLTSKVREEGFDIVLARLPEPTSALAARLYTEEFYFELSRAMSGTGVLCMTAMATPTNLTTASAEYLATICRTLGQHFEEVIVGWGSPAQVLAARRSGILAIEPHELAERYRQRGVESDIFNPAWFDGATDWLDADKVQQRLGEIADAGTVPLSTDMHPVVTMQRLALWEQMAGGPDAGGGRVVQWLRSIGWGSVLGSLVVLTGLTLLSYYIRGRRSPSDSTSAQQPWMGRGAIVLSIASTGFATMALSVIWLFAFQNLYGYVYQRIGWIIAIFMGGLVLGCMWANRKSKRIATQTGSWGFLWRDLIALDVLLALLALSVPWNLQLLGELQSVESWLSYVEYGVSIMVALTGFLGGAAFAAASNLQMSVTRQAEATAGAIVGADHAGACVGALVTGVLLVPVFGTAATAYLLVGIKLASAALLALGWCAQRKVALQHMEVQPPTHEPRP